MGKPHARSLSGLIRRTGVLVAVSATMAAAAAETPPTVAEVKAAYIYNFARFVEWPGDTFQRADGRFEVGVLGATELGDVLEEALLGKTIEGHEIVVHRFETLSNVIPVHILYVSPQSSSNLTDVLARAEEWSVLLVGDRARFARDGGAINFVLDRRRVRFEINLSGVRRSGLTASSQLLKLATALYEEPSK